MADIEIYSVETSNIGRGRRPSSILSWRDWINRYPSLPHPINVLSSTRCGAEMLTWPCPTYHSTLPTKRRRYIALSEDNTLSMTFDVKWDTETLQWHLQMYLTSNDTNVQMFTMQQFSALSIVFLFESNGMFSRAADKCSPRVEYEIYSPLTSSLAIYLPLAR